MTLSDQRSRPALPDAEAALSAAESARHIGGLDLFAFAVLIATLLLQAAGVFLWAGAVDQRLAHLERDVAALTSLLDRTARMEEQLADVRRALHRRAPEGSEAASAP